MQRILFLLVWATSLLVGASYAPAGSFDFEDQPAGTIVNAQYGSRGVIFYDAYVDNDPHAHSGTRVLRSRSLNQEIFSPEPFVLTFTSPQEHVSMYAGNLPGATGNGTLKAFDASGNLVAQDGPKPVPNDSFNAFFEVRVNTAVITRAELQINGTAFEAIDDLVVEGSQVAPPTQPPVVTFTSPADGAVIWPGPVPLRGIVAGESVLDRIVLRVKIGLPEDSTAPASDNVVGLSGTGANRTFSLDYQLIAGTYTVTAIATNTANLQGSATIHFSSLPDSILSRYQLAGGHATFGSLRFGTSEGDCVVAVYDSGLIAAIGQQTFVVLGPIFQKWMSTRAPGAPISRLGCPTAEERGALGGSRAQDFQKGRIYVSAAGTAYVPQAFRDAIETLGGEATTGIATADPLDSTGAMQTWLFQRFMRPGQPVEPSTLEIRGTPPVLYVERVGDGLEDLEGAGQSLSESTATVFRSFPCTGNLGPCMVRKPTWSPSISDGAPYCGGKYPITTLTEWARMLHDDYAASAIGGWVNSSKASCKDNPLTHDYNVSGCTSVGADVEFPSDWNIYVRPMAPYGSLLTFQQSYLEIEFEAYYAHALFAGLDWPHAGDLIYANGRWITDCGHEPFKTEIHPPFLMSDMRTVKRAGGDPETVAIIWVTGYHPGDPINVNLWPPPRPTPDAIGDLQ